MNRIAYHGVYASLPAAAVLAVGVVAGSTRHWLFAGFLLLGGGTEIALLGALLASNWKNATRRLRARQRIDRGGRGRLFAYICRDTVRWWRINGVLLLMSGLACVVVGVLFISRPP